jgi:hypothetical protein
MNYRGASEPFDPDASEKSALTTAGAHEEGRADDVLQHNKRTDDRAYADAQRIIRTSRDPATVRGAQDSLARIDAHRAQPQHAQLRAMNARARELYARR